jgi:hypothetical protein
MLASTIYTFKKIHERGNKIMAEFASAGKGNAALTTGIIGTALSGLLATGGLGNGLLNMGNARTAVGCCNEDHLVNRYEAGQDQKIAALETQVALRDSNIYTDQKLLEVYKYFDGEVKRIDKSICDQAVYNAANNATVNCIAGQIAQLMGLTKLIVPSSSVCPTPMPLYNSWTAPTAGGTTTG